MPNDQTPILIIGAGPTGLSLALSLTQMGIPVRIIDKLTKPTSESRAAGIHARTLELFKMLDVVDEVIQQGHQMHAISMFADGKQLAQWDYTVVESSFPYAIMLPQAKTEKILADKLSTYGIHVERGIELISLSQTDTAVEAQCHHANGQIETITTPYLIGCDGAHSTVRHQLGLEFTGETQEESWILIDAEGEWQKPDDHIYVSIKNSSLFFMFPFGNNQYRLGANYRETNSANDKLSQEEFQRIADEHFPDQLKINNNTWLSQFRISYRKVDQYNVNRVFLIGDAAHIHSPAGGQGMNTSIQDAINLAWKLSLVLKRQADSSLLESYFTERHPVALDVLQETEQLTKMVTLKNPILTTLRNLALPIASKLNSIQRHMIRQMSEIAVNYKDSPLISENWNHSAAGNDIFIKPGYRMPDVLLGDMSGDGNTQLISLLSLDKHHLLILLSNESDIAEAKKILNHINQHFSDLISSYVIYPQDMQPNGEFADQQCFQDINNECHQLLQAAQLTTYLIRPDGYIGFRNQPATQADLQAYLQSKYAN